MKNPAGRRALPGVLTAIAATTALDAGGLSAFSALVLMPLLGLFWYFGRHSRASMGFTWGRPRDYMLALLYPVFVLGAAVAIAWVTGAVDITATDWGKAGRNIALIAASTIVVAIVTEEGFFRGWLFASLERAGLGKPQVLIWSSIAFALWHLSAVTLDTGFDLPAGQVPVFMFNAALLGVIWGLLRQVSGSVIVASVSHGVWNGLAYVLFGFGTKTGALGIENTAFYGPESGFLGIALNLAFAAALYQSGQMMRARVPRG